MPRNYQPSLDHKIKRRCVGSPVRVWKAKRIPAVPARQPLDKCTAALWQVKSLQGKEIKFGGKSPDRHVVWDHGRTTVRPGSGFGGVIRQTQVILEDFRGRTLSFVRNTYKGGKRQFDHVHDLRDGTTMTVSEFENYVSDRIGQPWKFMF
jgi:hypothetical protein